MKLSLSFLFRYLPVRKTADEISAALTAVGLEVEGISTTGAPKLDLVVVGEVLAREQHPQADRLGVCRVDVGAGEPVQIVCGASNYKVGDRVPVALPGANLPTPDGKGFAISKSKLRGVDSAGMMCSAKELGLGDDHGGLLILTERPPIGAPINSVLPEGDTVLDISITPNRTDCLSHLGVARDLAAYFGCAVNYPQIRLNTVASDVLGRQPLITAVNVLPDAPCEHYRALSIRGVKVGPSPEWLQSLLKAIGLRPINNIVDATNFVLHELGQPLHAFDAAMLRGHQIVVRPARDGEKLTTLDGKERVLSSSHLVIADTERALVVAGIMGGVDSGVTDTTTDVVLESAVFDQSVVRKTARSLGLSSDSSYRFERGVDPLGVEFAQLRCADVIMEVAGGQLSGSTLVVGGPGPVEREIDVCPNWIRRRLGWEVSNETILAVFEGLNFDVRDEVLHLPDGASAGHVWRVSVPSYRLDLERPVDLVEEFLRIHGTDKIPASPAVSVGLGRPDDGAAAFNLRAAQTLAASGFAECKHYTTRDVRELETWWAKSPSDLLGLANPLASDQSHLRPSLIPGLLDALVLNFSRTNHPAKLCEVGSVFRPLDGVFWELQAVAFVLVQSPLPPSWRAHPQPDFFSAKAVVEQILLEAGIDADGVNWTPLTTEAAWQSGHAAGAGAFRKKFEVRCGLLNLRYTKARGLPGPVLAGEVLFPAEFLRKARTQVTAKHLSALPPAARDLALVVDAGVSADKVRFDLTRCAEKAASATAPLESLNLFDLYEGTGLPEGKKSLAFRLLFRPTEETLTDKVVNDVFAAIQKKIVEGTGYVIRT